ALGAHRPAALRGYDDPHVDALHRGGAAARRHGADHVPRRGRRPREAVRARPRARGARGARGLRAAEAARRGRIRGRRRGPQDAAQGDERLGPRPRGAQRPRRLRGRAQACEPRRRLRPADGGGDRLMATATRTARIGRLEGPAITGVLVREVVNFSSYWRAATFSSTVEPTIYLLAFG